MISTKTVGRVAAVMMLWGVCAAGPLAAVTCFPTCAPDDGRFLSLAGGGPLSTLSGLPLALLLLPPPGAGAFEVAIFDGDSGGVDGAGDPHWDLGHTPTLYSLRPCADRGCRTRGDPVATFDSSGLPDNEWFRFTVPVEPSIAAYRLEARLRPDLLGRTALNQIKVRTEGTIVLGEAEQPFLFVAEWTNLEDLILVYPRFDRDDWYAFDRNLVGARYDGTFTFRLRLRRSGAGPVALELWNGDLDRGRYDGAESDTDDLDTPSATTVQAPCPWELLPPFYRRPEVLDYARARVCSEGVAIGSGASTGSPPDENDPSLGGGLNRYICRPPSVYARVTVPGGRRFVDGNPSGNREWERFCLAETGWSEPGEPPPDVIVGRLAEGIYTVELIGLDHNNTSGWACRCVRRAADGEESEAGCDCEVLGPGPAGCTPGFWKQRHHARFWELYGPDDRFEEVFGVSVAGDPTLLEVLRRGGGGESALGRHAVAALLNAAGGGLDYLFGLREVIDMVQQAYASGRLEETKDLFERQNEIGCSL